MTQIEQIVQNNPETLEIVDQQIELYNQDKSEDQKISLTASQKVIIASALVSACVEKGLSYEDLFRTTGIGRTASITVGLVINVFSGTGSEIAEAHTTEDSNLRIQGT